MADSATTTLILNCGLSTPPSKISWKLIDRDLITDSAVAVGFWPTHDVADLAHRHHRIPRAFRT